jgi:hypothetical protein
MVDWCVFSHAAIWRVCWLLCVLTCRNMKSMVDCCVFLHAAIWRVCWLLCVLTCRNMTWTHLVRVRIVPRCLTWMHFGAWFGAWLGCTWCLTWMHPPVLDLDAPPGAWLGCTRCLTWMHRLIAVWMVEHFVWVIAVCMVEHCIWVIAVCFVQYNEIWKCLWNAKFKVM